jgi:hypothetical protein
VKDLEELAGMFPEETRRQFLGDNARALFKLPTPVGAGR